MTHTFRKDSKALAALAVPIAVTQLGQVALTTTDTVMMALLGTQALAAGGLAMVLFNQLRTMGVGLVTALGNQVAAESARQASSPDANPGPVRDLVRAGFMVATAAGIAGALIIIGLGQMLTLFGQDATVAADARTMLAALAPGLVPCLWFQVLRQVTLGMHRPKAVAWITVASIVVNTALSWALIFGFGPLPRLGLTGIGLTTTLVYLLSFVALYLILVRDTVLSPLVSLRGWRAPGADVRRLLRLGVPIAAIYGSEGGFFSVVALLVGSFGAAAIAAHTVVNQLVFIVFQISIGLSQAASIIVSGGAAVGDVRSIARTSRVALIHGAILMAAIGVGYLVAPNLVLMPLLGSSDTATMGIAVNLLAVAALLQCFDCAQNIGVGLLRGVDDNAASFRLTLIGYWLVGLPAVCLLGLGASLGPVGVWIGLLIGLATTAALLLRRFTRILARPSAACFTTTTRSA